MDKNKLTQEIIEAHRRIKGDILFTPLIFSHSLSEMVDGAVYLKLENEQYTGSFKARGSLNKLRSIAERNQSNEVITASTGNHGLGFARAVQLTGLSGTVYLPKSASPFKIKRLSYYPVTLEFYDGDSLSTELAAKESANDKKAIWVSPYNDIDVIAGQGTIAREILEKVSSPDSILVTVGGGGLIAGIGTYFKTNSPQTQIVACQPKNSPEMTLSLEAGKIVQLETPLPTLSDGSAGGIEPGSITFEICQQIVDHTVLVTEDQIENGIRLMVSEHGKIIEGSAAVTIASLLKEKEQFAGKTTVLVICGGNIATDKLTAILNN